MEDDICASWIHILRQSKLQWDWAAAQRSCALSRIMTETSWCFKISILEDLSTSWQLNQVFHTPALAAAQSISSSVGLIFQVCKQHKTLTFIYCRKNWYLNYNHLVQYLVQLIWSYHLLQSKKNPTECIYVHLCACTNVHSWIKKLHSIKTIQVKITVGL